MEQYNQAKRRYDLNQAMAGQAMQPIRGASAGSTVAKMLQSYFASRGMRDADRGMQGAEQADQNELKMALSQALGAYRGDTPYNQSPDETFPGEAPIQGLRNEGSGQDVNAMAQAMMNSGRRELAGPGMTALMSQPKPDKKTALMQNLQAAGYVPGSPEYQQKMVEIMSKPGSSTTFNNRVDPAPPPGYRNVYDDQGKLINQEAIPGGPAATKQQAESDAAVAAQEQQSVTDITGTEAKNEFLNQVDKALTNNTFWTTGMLGSVLSNWKGSDARYQEKLLERIQGEVALDRLAQAQAASKTGGVFGSLQEKELNLLMNSIAALEVGMSEEQMAEGLGEIRDHRLKWEGYQDLWTDQAWVGSSLKPEERMAGFGDYDADRGGIEILNNQAQVIGYYK